MPDDIKLPGLGQVDKKYVIGGVVIAGGIVVMVFLRNKSQANAANAASTDTSAADTSGGTSGDSGIDPATGIPYAEESGGGGLNDYGGSYGSYQNEGYDAAGYPLGSEADLQWQAGQTPGTTNDITTNEQWLEEAESGVVPGSVSTIGDACSKVLGGLPVTTAQRNLFLEVVGVIGNPPGGYPTPIKLKDTSGQPAPGKKETTVEANGNQDLSEFAKAHNTTGGKLILLTGNKWLSRYYGNTKKIPKGYKIRVAA
jgi:hypothetical protein